MKLALYSRVSTRDQRLDGQLDELRAYAQRRGADQVLEFQDHGVSGAKSKRPGLDALLAACRRREVDAVVVVKLDRLGRSLRHLLEILGELEELGIAFVALEDGLDTATAVGRLFLQVRGAFAEYERALIAERAESGRKAARRRGVRFGRPRSTDDRAESRIARLRRTGHSVRAIAAALELPPSVVHRRLTGA